MTKAKPSKKNGTAAKNDTKHSIKRTISSYNLFYILERELVLYKNRIPPRVKYVREDDWENYGDLSREFPPRPSRYRSLELSDTWFVKRMGRSRNRPIKNQDAICLKGLSKAISSSWKICDDEVKDYVTAVAEIIKQRSNKILSSLSGMKSTPPSPSLELKPSDLKNPPFEPALEDKQNTYDRRVSMGSSESSIGVHNVPYEVHNAWIQQQQLQLANIYGIFPLSTLQQPTILPYSNMANCNAELNRINADVIGRSSTLLDGHQPNESVCAMASDPESTCFNSSTLIEGLDIKAAGQYENTSYPTVKKHSSDEGASNVSNVSSRLRDREEEVSQQYMEEDANSNFESFLHEDPNQSGWSQSAYFKNYAMSISGPNTLDDDEREYVADHYIAEGASQQKEDSDLKGN